MVVLQADFVNLRVNQISERKGLIRSSFDFVSTLRELRELVLVGSKVLSF